MARKTLGGLIAKHPEALHLLDKHGITFCAGCFLTLFATPERAAVYHAVPDPKKFLAELERLIKPRRRRSSRKR